MRADSNPCSRPLSLFVRAFCGALLLAIGGNALSLPGKRFVGRYDFGYAIRGDRPARPAQVFDDGSGKIYFEARPHQPMPAVFAGKDLALLVLQPEGQYFTGHTTAGEFTLVLGGARATVRRGEATLGDEVVTTSGTRVVRPSASADPAFAAGTDDDPPAAPAALQHEQPVVFPADSATLRPQVLDALSALVVRMGRTTSITVVGRNDAGLPDALATSRAEALRNALLARGVAADRLRLVRAAALDDGAPHASSLRWQTAYPRSASDNALGPSFDILPSDPDIAVSLRRWARASDFDIAWDVPWVAPVNGRLHVDAATFPGAVRQVVAGLRAQGYPVQARVWADRLVQFTSAE